MITSKKDLQYYIDEDRKALGIPKQTVVSFVKSVFLPDHIWEFEKLLRKNEYYANIRKTHRISLWYNLMFLISTIRMRRKGLKLGFSIPINVFGPGLSIPHYGTIVVNGKARVGANCRLHTSVNIGASAGEKGAPVIGDNCYIGPGAIIFGNISIANNVTIAANATVNRSCENENVVLAGTPAKIVKEEMPSWKDFNKK